MARRKRITEVVRVSRVNGRDKDAARVFRSPDEQRAANAGLARMLDGDIVTSYEDLDESGGTMNRPGMQAALADIEAGRAEIIVTAKVDRYTRDVAGALVTLERIHAAGGELRTADLADVDFASPNGRFIFVTMANMAERERNEKKAGLARSTRAATLEGIAIAKPLPGYRKGDDRRIELDPDRSRLIRPMFERRAAGHSWTAIREWWHDETGEWVKLSRFRKMVESRLYLGELTYGDVTSPVHHPALVTERLWQEAQTVAAPRPRRSADSTALLAGILECSGCGRPMTLSRGGGSRGVLYRCQSRAKTSWVCPAPVTIMADRVDEWVVEQFLARAAATVVTTDELDADFELADAKVADAEAELDAYLDATDARDPYFKRGAEKRRAAVEEARGERAALEAERRAVGVYYRVADEWPSLTVDEKRQMLRAGIERGVVHPASLTDAGGRARLPVADRVALTFADDG